jgi:histidinol-phosphate aminotransferase
VLFGRFDDQTVQWQALLERGILVRDVGLPGWLRVSVGTTQECELFLAAMEEVIAR